MIRLHSVGTRLSLALVAIVAAGLTFVYLIVVPPLEDRLVDGKLDQLEADARPLAAALREEPADLGGFLENASAASDARVLVMREIERGVLGVFEDSQGTEASAPYEDDPIAEEALETGGLARGTAQHGDERFAEVGVPIPNRAGDILLLSASLRDQLESVEHVEQRLLLAGILALLASVVIGYGGAWLFARRLRRLEYAAERIAAGDFDEPVTDRGTDEIGELAAAFDHMRRRLSQLDHARREFVANASHELRTPLFSIAGSLELLADENLDEETRTQFIGTMREQVDRLSRLAADLLDLSRLDAGRIVAEEEAVELDRIVRTLADEYRAVAQAREHTLEVDGEASVRALGDEQWVLRIGRALVENALIHTPPGTTVRVRAGEAAGEALLVVEDNGPGIPREHMDHVFDRFYRVDGAKASGSGLGLAIARELAELMGGSVDIASQPGKTVLTVSLAQNT